MRQCFIFVLFQFSLTSAMAQSFYDYCGNVSLWSGNVSEIAINQDMFYMTSSGTENIKIISNESFSNSNVNRCLSFRNVKFSSAWKGSRHIQVGLGNGMSVGIDDYGDNSYYMYNGQSYPFRDSSYSNYAPSGLGSGANITVLYIAAENRLLIIQSGIGGAYKAKSGTVTNLDDWFDNPVVLVDRSFLQPVDFSQYPNLEISISCSGGGYTATLDDICYEVQEALPNECTFDYSNMVPLNRGIIGHQWFYKNSAKFSSSGGFLRGIAPGLEADAYNWKTRQGIIRDGTVLGFLKDASNYDCNTVMTVNVTGLGNYGTYSNFVYAEETLSPLVSLAGDLVRYCNYTLQNYVYGNYIPPGVDRNVLSSLDWSPNLLSSFEKPLHKVGYWEIGNEPGNFAWGYSGSGFDYHQRYKTISNAILMQDPAAKVGGSVSNKLEILNDSACAINFATRHPYYLDLGRTLIASDSLLPEAVVEAKLRDLAYFYKKTNREIRNAFSGSNRDNSRVELLFTEWNPLGFDPPANYIDTLACQLAVADSMLTFGVLGISGANYYLEAGRYDVSTASESLVFEKMRGYLGDGLIGYWDNYNLKLYATYNSHTKQIVLWGINFDSTSDKTVNLSFSNFLNSNSYEVSSNVLISNITPNSLYAKDAVWHESSLGSMPLLENLNVTFPSASLTLIIATPQKCLNSGVPPVSDFNGDCIVNFLDLAKFAESWQKAN